MFRLWAWLLLIPSLARAEEPPYFHLHLSKVNALRDRVAREVVTVAVERDAAGVVGQRLRFDGGGIHVGEGRVLTCAFYLKGAAEIRVGLPDGRVVPARLARESLPEGLALLEVPEARGLPAPEIAPESGVPRGAAVFLLANPTTRDAQIRVGWLLQNERSGFYWRATFVARNGHPVYDEWGRVVGIAALPAKEGASALFVPPWAIRKFLGLEAADGLEAERRDESSKARD